MHKAFLLLPLLVACKDPEPLTQFGTTLPDDGDDTDFDGVPNGQDCNPDDADVYPGAYDAPGDGIDADCDGEDPAHDWVGEWQVVDMQALYTTYPILVPGTGEGTLVVDADGDAELDARAALDPSLTGVPFEVFADLTHSGHAAPQARVDQLMLYLDGEVEAPGLAEVSYADMLCTADADAMHCEGTLKALEITLDTDVWLERD
jgi:hypothetical protein